MKTHEAVVWHARWKIERYSGDWAGDDIVAGLAPLLDVLEGDGNLLMYGGSSALWERLIGTGVTAFDNSNAYLGVGDSNTAASATQTDLQASSNKLRKAMDATYPQHTDGTGSTTNATITFRSTFASGDANFAWEEWALFNASSSGRMLNRKAVSMGTKTSAQTWTLTVTLVVA